MPLLRRIAVNLAALCFAASAAGAGTPFSVSPVERQDLKSVFGRVESRNVIPARARIGGTVTSLSVQEGSAVKAGDVLAVVKDDKLALQREALGARLRALEAELDNASTELQRGEQLITTGAIARSRLDALKTRVDVLTNQIASATAERAVVEQQAAEGEVLAPASGRVLTVPVTRDAVILPGEPVARIAGGGYFLRLSLPERHAAEITEGSAVLVGGRGITANGSLGATRKGKLVKVYPEIDGGRVLADVEVEGLDDFFVGERTLVWVPVATRQVLAVPPGAIVRRHGVDFVTLVNGGSTADVAIVAGETFDTPDGPRVEVLSGLVAGDTVVAP
jgi:RND family efflux transporter MFP subunit